MWFWLYIARHLPIDWIFVYRKYDFENYLCTIYLRPKDRACAFAVRAFNIEVANIEGQVSNVSIGQMRLKFWEESIDKIFNDNPPHHPVTQEVHRVRLCEYKTSLYNMTKYEFRLMHKFLTGPGKEHINEEEPTSACIGSC